MYNNPFSSAKPGGGGGDVSSQLMVTVKQDMESAEVSGQWIFSCYSPGKDCVSVPGMDDVSPEELRSVRSSENQVKSSQGLLYNCFQARGLQCQGCQHDGSVLKQDQRTHRGLLSQEEQDEEPGPEHETSPRQDLQQREH